MNLIKLAIVYTDIEELNKIYDFLKQKPLHYIKKDGCLVLDMYGLNDYDLCHSTTIGILSAQRILLTFEEFKQLHFDLSIGLIPFDHETISERFSNDKL